MSEMELLLPTRNRLYYTPDKAGVKAQISEIERISFSPSRRHAPMLDRTISHYNIQSQLGEGGMGVVYEAEDTSLGRHVALKFLTPALAGDESLLQRFQREARAASALNHPNICTIHGIEQFESEHFIVMELLDGESLADRIRRGPLDIESVLTLSLIHISEPTR